MTREKLPRILYKSVSIDAYQNYIKKGKFALRPLSYYRKSANVEVGFGDPVEGVSGYQLENFSSDSNVRDSAMLKKMGISIEGEGNFYIGNASRQNISRDWYIYCTSWCVDAETIEAFRTVFAHDLLLRIEDVAGFLDELQASARLSLPRKYRGGYLDWGKVKYGDKFVDPFAKDDPGSLFFNRSELSHENEFRVAWRPVNPLVGKDDGIFFQNAKLAQHFQVDRLY